MAYGTMLGRSSWKPEVAPLLSIRALIIDEQAHCTLLDCLRRGSALALWLAARGLARTLGTFFQPSLTKHIRHR